MISTKVGMYIQQDCLIVPIQTELRNKMVERLQMDILEKIRKARLRDVIIDLSGVSLLDTYQTQKIFDTGKMAKLLGAATVFTGLSAGIVISLIDLDFEPGEVLTAISLEEGVELLRSIKGSASGETDADDDADDDMDAENDPDKESDLQSNDEREEDGEGKASDDPY